MIHNMVFELQISPSKLLSWLILFSFDTNKASNYIKIEKKSSVEGFFRRTIHETSTDPGYLQKTYSLESASKQKKKNIYIWIFFN